MDLCSKIVFNIDPHFPTFLQQYGKVSEEYYGHLCPQPGGTETYYRVLEIQLEREGIPVIGTRNNNVAVGSLFPLIQYIEIVKNEMILTVFSDSEDIIL